MIDFKKGDEVKWSYDWSIIMNYGKVLIVREKSCTILVSGPNGQTEKVTVRKNLLNWN